MKLIAFMVVVLAFSIIYAILDSYPSFTSSYDLGYSAGVMFGHMIKIIGMFSLIVFAFRAFKMKNDNSIPVD